MEETKDYEMLGENFQNYDYSFKIIVIGDSGINKLFLIF